ncbi:6-bladed beta-propeller [Parabacteroides sp. OttesenSCG-928-G07]|nr:6-bladed beta-propeller [Parabacteroides sp. OttesenSCG-928-G07]
MKTTFLYLPLLSLFFLIACNQKTTENSINPEWFIEQDILLSDYIEEISYIRLSSEELIDRIDRLEFADEFIIISTGEGILKYDYSGNFIGKIGNKGVGPMEYTSSRTFTIDNNSQQVFVRDGQQIKVFSFDGKYIQTIQVKNIDGYIDLAYHDQKIYLISLIPASTTKTEHFWYAIDLNGNVVNAKTNHDVIFEGNGMTLFGSFIYKTKDYLGYWNHYNDTIFHIRDNDVVTPAFIWAKGNYRYTTQKAVEDNIQSSLRLRTVFETDKLLYMQYSRSDNSHICIYNKPLDHFADMPLNKFDKNGMINDMDGGLPLLPTQVAALPHGDYFIQTVYPHNILDYLEANPGRQASNNLEILMEDLTEEDNPVIIMAKIK